MFKISQTLIEKIKNAIVPMPMEAAVGNVVLSCFGCSGECSSGCKGSCHGSCAYGCGGPCSGHSR